MNKPPYKVPTMEQIGRIPWNGKYVVSTFSGCGGSSLGYKMAGFRVLWANEFIPAAQETYKANHPSTFLDTRDIRVIKPSEILEKIGLDKGELDLFDGSPPCRDFSMAGNRDWESDAVKKYSDTKQRTDDLFDEYIRLLVGLMPKTFIAENVAGMTIGKAKDFLGDFQEDMFKDKSNEVIRKLQDCNYLVRYRVLNAADLGVPQTRRRIIIHGVRRDIAKAHNLEPNFPTPLPYKYTIRDAIPWIAKVYDGKESTIDAKSNQSPTVLASDGGRASSSFDQGLGYIEAETCMENYATGKEWERLKIGEQSDKYFSLIRSNPDGPSPTICAKHGSRGGIACTTHPYEKRKWSIAELKRICGFPDNFILTGTYEKQWERLGRAVPPVMMKYIAMTVRSKILRHL